MTDSYKGIGGTSTLPEFILDKIVITIILFKSRVLHQATMLGCFGAVEIKRINK